MLNAIEGAECNRYGDWIIRQPFHRRWPSKNWRLWEECIDAAERIRTIAIGARNRGAHIRWFDFDKFEKGHPTTRSRYNLVPVNSVEIVRRARRPRPTALDYLALSVANKQSLVFRSLPDEEAPGVLLTADSDLQFDDRALDVQAGEIVTSPHHGSEANAKAYEMVDKRVGAHAATLTWIRSDGRFRSRPGKAFRDKQAQAACTRCKGHNTPGQAVELVGANGSWSLVTDKCSCRVQA